MLRAGFIQELRLGAMNKGSALSTFEEKVMLGSARNPSECLARALALLIGADAHLDTGELARLEEVDAFRRLGVSRARFLELVEACCQEVGERVVGQSWLSLDDLQRIDYILDAVEDPQQRLLVCRLAASVLPADGCISEAERLIYDHVLGHWHINRSAVTETTLRGAVH